MEHTQNNKIDLTKPNVSRQFRRKNSDGSFTRGHGCWEDMADKETWNFVVQLLPDYERKDEVMWSDDLACVLDEEHDYKDLAWLHENYSNWEGLSVDELKKVRAQLDYELMQEAEGYLTAAIQSGEIEVREFPVIIVSAITLGDGENTLVPLTCADETDSSCGREFALPASQLQNVKCRTVFEDEDSDRFQIYYQSTNSSGIEYWCDAKSVDFI